ncbi:hypothetical protein SLA2020_049080 [Shorea laevis]
MREKGIEKEIFDKYELLFNENVATCRYSHAPSCDPPLNGTEKTKNDKIEEEKGNANLEEDFALSVDELMECGISFGDHRKSFETETISVNEYKSENSEGISRVKNKYDDDLGVQNKTNKKFHKKKSQIGQSY